MSDLSCNKGFDIFDDGFIWIIIIAIVIFCFCGNGFGRRGCC